ncbi:hypothetical protein D3C71_2040660 [compost metagenome]
MSHPLGRQEPGAGSFAARRQPPADDDAHGALAYAPRAAMGVFARFASALVMSMSCLKET